MVFYKINNLQKLATRTHFVLIDPSQVFNKLRNESEYYDLVTDTIELKKNNILSEIKNNFTMKMLGPTVQVTNSLELADRSPKCADVRTLRGKQQTYR